MCACRLTSHPAPLPASPSPPLLTTGSAQEAGSNVSQRAEDTRKNLEERTRETSEGAASITEDLKAKAKEAASNVEKAVRSTLPEDQDKTA